MIVSEDIADILSEVSDLLSPLSGQRILITGGTGFVGSYFLETLAAINDGPLKNNPCGISLLTRNASAFSSRMPHIAARKEVHILEGDVRTYDYADQRYDHIIHGAAAADPRVVRDDPFELMETISRGTVNVLRLAEKSSVKSFLFLSSGAVYGTQPPGLKKVPEDYAGGPSLDKPESGYAEGKRYGEVLCSVYKKKYGLPIKIARLFSFVGPYQDLNAGFAATEYIKNCLNKEPINIKSDGMPLRSYCYSADLSIALWKILLGDKNSTYNVGSEDEISIKGLAELVSSNFNHETRIVIQNPPEERKEPPRYIPDTARLRKDYKFKPKYSTEESINRTINWFKHQKKPG